MPVGFSSHSTASIAAPLAIAMLRFPLAGFCFGSGSFSTFAGALHPPGAPGSRVITKSSCGPDFSSAALVLAVAVCLGRTVGWDASGAIVQSSPFIAVMISDALRLPERLAGEAAGATGATPISVASFARSSRAVAPVAPASLSDRSSPSTTADAA